jgi:hypothetical protein
MAQKYLSVESNWASERIEDDLEAMKCFDQRD